MTTEQVLLRDLRRSNLKGATKAWQSKIDILEHGDVREQHAQRNLRRPFIHRLMKVLLTGSVADRKKMFDEVKATNERQILWHRRRNGELRDRDAGRPNRQDFIWPPESYIAVMQMLQKLPVRSLDVPDPGLAIFMLNTLSERLGKLGKIDWAKEILRKHVDGLHLQQGANVAFLEELRDGEIPQKVFVHHSFDSKQSRFGARPKRTKLGDKCSVKMTDDSVSTTCLLRRNFITNYHFGSGPSSAYIDVSENRYKQLMAQREAEAARKQKEEDERNRVKQERKAHAQLVKDSQMPLHNERKRLMDFCYRNRRQCKNDQYIQTILRGKREDQMKAFLERKKNPVKEAPMKPLTAAQRNEQRLLEIGR